MRFHDDEFNKERIVNEEGISSFEFGNTQKNESTSYKDNDDSIHDEVNDNPVENSSNSKKEEEKQEKDNKDSQNNHSGKSGNGAHSGGAVTVGAAAVAAASIVTGIVSLGAAALPQAPEINNVKLTPHETSIECAFDIVDAESHKYKVELYNDQIDDRFEQECQINHNELEFTDLHSSTEYTFEIFMGTLNEENQEYNFESIYSEIVSTLEIGGPVVVSFSSNGRDGTMSSIELERNSEFKLPVSIFVPFKDEIFGGWKINGEGENIAPGETIVVKNDTVLLAGWDKLPTEEKVVTGNSMMFSQFPTQPSSSITTVSNIMDIDFNIQNVYFDSSTSSLNFTSDGGFVSTTRPFGGVISKIEINTSEAQTGDIDYTVVYSASPIYEKVTEPGETHTIGSTSSYTFYCTNPDARYFCLSVGANDIEAAIQTIVFTYNIPVMDKEFSVSFDANGGSGTCSPYTIRANSGQLPEIEEVGFTAPSGYEFAGWKINGEGDILAPGTTIGISCDITLVAQWQPAPEYIVTFDSNGGSPVDSQTVFGGDCAVRPDDPTKYAYLFVDWYTDDEFTTPYDFNEKVKSDITLIANWKPDVDFSMYINYVDTLSASPTNQLSFNYTKKDDYSLFTNYNLELHGEATMTVEVGSLDNQESYTAKTVEIDEVEASSLGSGIINYTMKGITSSGESYDLATGSLSMSKTQKDYWLHAYIGDKELLENSAGEIYRVMSIGTEGGGSSSSSYYIPLTFDFADYSKSHGSSDWTLYYSVDGESVTSTSFSYSGGTASVSISKDLFDSSTKQATFAKIYFKDQYSGDVGKVYQNVTLEVSDERYVGGFQLNTSNLLNPSQTPTLRISACGTRGANPDNLYENYTYTTLGVNEDNFQATLTFKLLSRGGQIEKKYTIDIVSYLQSNATKTMWITNVSFEFIDTNTGVDKREEFIEQSKRYVVDVELSITPASGTSFVCKSYESYSFR